MPESPSSRDEQAPAGAGPPDGVDRPFFKVAILLFLGALVYLLLPKLSPFVVAASVLLLLVFSHRRARFEVGVGLVFFLLLTAYLFHEVAGVLWPFVVSFVLAYLLEPLVGVLGRHMPRSLAIGTIVLLLLGALAGTGILLVPMVIAEVWDLVQRLPEYAADIRDLYEHLEATLRAYGYATYAAELQRRFVSNLPEVGKLFADQTTSALRSLTSGLAALLNLLIIPFVTYYVLKDFGRIKQILTEVLPARHRTVFLSFLSSVDDVLGQYVRGQFIVCSFVAVLTAVGLSLSGIRYGVVLGLTAGALNLIPYVGISTTLGIALIVAVLDADPWITCLKVLIVFTVVQGLEGNFLSPRVVGQRVGLHPAWVIFALVVCANAWGFLGMIVAIPAAAVANIVIKIVMARYYGSSYYTLDA